MTRLHIREWGRGDRMAVVIHGLSGWSATWDAVGSELARYGFHVVAPDLRGHGQSPRGSYSIEEWTSDLVENLPAGAALAIGHSMGGVLLLEAVARLKPAFAVYEDPAWRLAPDPEKTIAEFEMRKRLTIDDIARANPRWPDEVLRMRIAGLALWDSTTARAFIGPKGDRTPATPPAVPSLVLLADGSPYVSPQDAERIGSMGWDVRTLPGTGHHLHIDDRPAFMSSILEGLAGSRSGIQPKVSR
jgi:pimeloyl-ACP methyl ester carboxylesterase